MRLSLPLCCAVLVSLLAACSDNPLGPSADDRLALAPRDAATYVYGTVAGPYVEDTGSMLRPSRLITAEFRIRAQRGDVIASQSAVEYTDDLGRAATASVERLEVQADGQVVLAGPVLKTSFRLTGPWLYVYAHDGGRTGADSLAFAFGPPAGQDVTAPVEPRMRLTIERGDLTIEQGITPLRFAP